MNTTTLNTTLTLHRRWPLRALDAVHAAWERWRDERIARRAIDAALEIPESTLRDIGAPMWLLEEARARREAGRLDHERLRLHDLIGSRYY
jgi:hypothetical protein